MAESNTQHIPETLNYFLTLPDEKLILLERKHWIVLAQEMILAILLGLPFYATSYFLFNRYSHYPTIFISTLLVIASITISLIVKSIIDWNFHFFIVTNRKILEVYYSPLFFYKINGVLLDQVRCTEIDEKKHGILNEFVDMGDIVITFDRPTHQEEFIFTNIKNPRNVANTLSNMFASLERNDSQPIWYKMYQKASMFPLRNQNIGRYSLGGIQ